MDSCWTQEPRSHPPDASTATFRSAKGKVTSVDLKEENIADQWHAILPRCHKDGPGLLAAIEENLEAAGVPEMTWSQESVAAGAFQSLRGRRRDALVVRYRPLREWQVALLAHAFGENLHVSWLVVVAPKRMRGILRALCFSENRATRGSVGSELGTFERQQLAAFIAVTDDVAKAAIATLCAERHVSWESLWKDGIEWSES